MDAVRARLFSFSFSNGCRPGQLCTEPLPFPSPPPSFPLPFPFPVILTSSAYIKLPREEVPDTATGRQKGE